MTAQQPASRPGAKAGMMGEVDERASLIDSITEGLKVGDRVTIPNLQGL